MVETRFGAGGGIVGPGRTKLTHGTTRVKHAPSPVNARWLSSIPVPSSRRPGTTTDAGRRILRRAKNGNSRTQNDQNLPGSHVGEAKRMV